MIFLRERRNEKKFINLGFFVDGGIADMVQIDKLSKLASADLAS